MFQHLLNFRFHLGPPSPLPRPPNIYAEVESSWSPILEQLPCKMKPSLQALDTKKMTQVMGLSLRDTEQTSNIFTYLVQLKNYLKKRN